MNGIEATGAPIESKSLSRRPGHGEPLVTEHAARAWQDV